jgi:hypothetical protein
MPDRPEGDHRRSRFRGRLRTPLILVALLVVAASASTAGAFVGAAAARKSSRPVVSGFAFSPPNFAVGAVPVSTRAKRVTTIRYHLSKRATVVVTIARKTSGRRSRGHCVRASAKLAKKRACTRYVTSGKLVRSRQSAGDRAIAFSGRFRGKPLSPGAYRATIVATDARHHRSRAQRTKFTIQRPQSSNSAPPPASGGNLPAGAQRRSIRPCTVTLPDLGALTSAVAAAAPGSVVCIAPGTYGKLSLAGRHAGEVVVQPAGIATIAGADINGANVTLEGFNVTDEVTIREGSDHIKVQFNYITGGYMGVNLWTDDVPISDVSIVGNRFVGPFGEDGIRANRYHDGDGDGVGLLVEGNEFTGIRENGNHSDCLQSVWVGDHLIYRRNYLHDNRCQGFFIKDQKSPVDTVVAEDNLMLRNAAPCDGASCGQPTVFHLFGPMNNLTVRHNTIWTPEGGSQTSLREGGWGAVSFTDNVVSRLWTDTSAPFASYSASNNVARSREGPWPATGVAIVANPKFANPAADDYRTNDGRGVTWAPADQHFGP